MDVQGKWWFLEEEEPFNEATTRQITIEHGTATVGDRRGTWSQTADLLTIAFPATEEAPERRLYLDTAGDRNLLSGMYFEAFSGFPEGFNPRAGEAPDDVVGYSATLGRVEPVGADIIELDFGGR